MLPWVPHLLAQSLPIERNQFRFCQLWFRNQYIMCRKVRLLHFSLWFYPFPACKCAALLSMQSVLSQHEMIDGFETGRLILILVSFHRKRRKKGFCHLIVRCHSKHRWVLAQSVLFGRTYNGDIYWHGWAESVSFHSPAVLSQHLTSVFL